MPDLLKAYTPTKSRPWDRAAAASLLRRAGFCPSRQELSDAVSLGPSDTVDRLIDEPERSPRALELDGLASAMASRGDVAALRGWWLLRMRHTSRPLAARLSVFWHNHFATSHEKVRDAGLMALHLRTIERAAFGGFGALLLAMARDPAMIVWLDGEQNVKGRPNENFARELFELFALGVGNYTEPDIREAARAFTGWRQRAGRFEFSISRHDDGPKTVFGQTGAFGGEDIVRLTLAQPAASKFLAGKLAAEFVCPDPPRELCAALADVLRETGFGVAAALRIVLKSRAMHEPTLRGRRIKSPIELVIGLARSLELSVGADKLETVVSEMGQRLLEPPSVKGWEGHRGWLNSATMLVRLSAAARAVSAEAGFDPGRLRREAGAESREDALALCRELALGADLPPALEKQLEALPASLDDAMREALRRLLCSPEYQMA